MTCSNTRTGRGNEWRLPEPEPVKVTTSLAPHVKEDLEHIITQCVADTIEAERELIRSARAIDRQIATLSQGARAATDEAH
jgi:hypothetical protein